MERTFEIQAAAAAEGSLLALAARFDERMVASGYAPASLKSAGEACSGFRDMARPAWDLWPQHRVRTRR